MFQRMTIDGDFLMIVDYVFAPNTDEDITENL